MSASNRKTASFGVPWESAYGYVQAVRVNNTIFVSGQLSHTPEGHLVAPAELGANGKPANFDTMEAQMRRTYENAQAVLVELGGSLADVVEETLFVIDVPAAFAASGGPASRVWPAGAKSGQQPDWCLGAGLPRAADRDRFPGGSAELSAWRGGESPLPLRPSLRRGREVWILGTSPLPIRRGRNRHGSRRRQQPSPQRGSRKQWSCVDH